MYRPKGTEKHEAGDHLVFTSGSRCSVKEYVLSSLSQRITSCFYFCQLIGVVLKTWGSMIICCTAVLPPSLLFFSPLFEGAKWSEFLKLYFSLLYCVEIADTLLWPCSLKRNGWGISQPSGCNESASLYGSSAAWLVLTACQGEETMTLLHRS